MKLYSRLVIDNLNESSNPMDLIESALHQMSLAAIESIGTPAWDTLRVAIEPDGAYHVITITVLEA